MSSKFSYDPKSMKRYLLYLQLLLFLWLPEILWKETESMKSAGAKGASASESAEAEEDISQEVQLGRRYRHLLMHEDEAAANPAADTIYVDITGESIPRI